MNLGTGRIKTVRQGRFPPTTNPPADFSHRLSLQLTRLARENANVPCPLECAIMSRPMPEPPGGFP